MKKTDADSHPLNASWCSEKWGEQCGFTIKDLTQYTETYISYIQHDKKSSQLKITPVWNIWSFFRVLFLNMYMYLMMHWGISSFSKKDCDASYKLSIFAVVRNPVLDIKLP